MTRKQENKKTRPAFTLIEVILALVILTIFMGAAAILFLSTREGAQMSLDYTRATFLAKEGIEAVRSIRDSHFLNLEDGVHGLIRENGYRLGPAPEIIDEVFERRIIIESVYRDTDGNIVPVGILDPEIKKITAKISFPGMDVGTRSVSESTYLSNWRSHEFMHTSVSDFSSGTFSNIKVVSVPPPPTDNGALALETVFTSDGFYSSADIGEHGDDVVISQDGRYAFATTSKSQAGLAVVDIGEPDNLEVEATLDIGGKGNGMAVKGGLLAVGVENRYWGFALVDVSDPEGPRLISTLNIPDAIVNEVVLDGNFAYATTDRYHRGAAIIDISNPVSPRVISFVDFDSDGAGIALVDSVDGKILLVGRKDSGGLAAINVNDPYNPVFVDGFSFGDHRYPSGIVLQEPFTFMSVASGQYEMFVFAAHPDGNIEIVAQTDFGGGDAEDISKSDDLIAVAIDDARHGIIIIDIADPMHPKVLESKNIGRKAFGLAFMSPYIAVATDTSNEGFVLVGGGTRGFAPSGTYTSSPIDIGSANPEYLSVDFKGYSPPGSYTGVELRSAGSIPALASAPWSEVYTQFPSRLNLPAGRYVQYRITLSGNSAVSPVFDSFIIKYLP